MIVHGKEKGKNTADQDLCNKLKNAYEKMDIYSIALYNPDDYTAQNKIKDELNAQNADELLSHNVQSIQNNVKSYQAWYQRRYIQNKYLHYKDEYHLICKCLTSDARNFHCWNYWRWLTKKIAQEASKACDTAIDMQKESSAADDKKKTLSKLQNIPQKLYNLDFSNFSAIHNIQTTEYIDKMYTDPYDEGLWVLHRKMKEKELFAAKPFYIKVYDTRIEIHLAVHTNKLTVHINDKTHDLQAAYDVKRYAMQAKLCKNDKIRVIVCNNEYNIVYDDSTKECDAFVDEILDIDKSCHFAWYEKLLHTKGKKERDAIVQTLAKLDSKRCNYYKDLVHYNTI